MWEAQGSPSSPCGVLCTVFKGAWGDGAFSALAPYGGYGGGGGG